MREKIRKILNILNRIDVLENRVDILDEKTCTLENWKKQLEYKKRIVPFLETNGLIDKKIYLKENYRIKDMDLFYINIGKVFRNDKERMEKNINFILPYIKRASKLNKELPIIDIGCGKGDFLDALQNNNIKYIGIDLNRENAVLAENRGHKIIIGDAFPIIKEKKDNSLAGITMFQVVEHVPFKRIFENIFVFFEKINKNGILMINTINPYCYRRIGNFFLDPSHINFTPPEIYKIIMEMAGFSDIKIWLSEPIDIYNQEIEVYTQYENFYIIGEKK